MARIARREHTKAHELEGRVDKGALDPPRKEELHDLQLFKVVRKNTLLLKHEESHEEDPTKGRERASIGGVDIPELYHAHCEVKKAQHLSTTRLCVSHKLEDTSLQLTDAREEELALLRQGNYPRVVGHTSVRDSEASA